MAKSSSPAESGVPKEQTLLAEYAAANSIYLAYDGFRWQAGSFLIAGVFVYWGFVISNAAEPPLIAVSSVLITLLMSCWLLFAHHYRQLYTYKLLRLHEIERELHMEQHRRFRKGAPSGQLYRAHGLRGHWIDALVYVLTALGGVVLACTKNGPIWPSLAVVLPLVGVVLVVVGCQERLLQKDVDSWQARMEASS